MLYVTLTFALVFGSVVGAYWLFVVRPMASSKQRLWRRIEKQRIDTRRKLAPLLRVRTPLSRLGAIQALLSRSGGHAAELQRLIYWSQIPATVGAVVLACVFLGILTFSIVSGLTGASWIALCAAGPAALLPYGVVRYLARRQIERFEEQFPEAIGLLARALQAGHAFTTGLSLAAEEMADPTRREFRAVWDKQNYGMPLEQALKEFAGRVRLLDASFFVTAVLTQRDSGGNLSEILERLADLIRDRFRVKRQIRVLSAHGRFTGWVLGLLAPALAAILFLIAPEHMSKLVIDPLGQQMVTVAVALQVVGVLIVRRIIRMEY